MKPDSDAVILLAELEAAFPTLREDRPLYVLEGDVSGAPRLIAATRAAQPDATILVLTQSEVGARLKTLLHAGADGVFDLREEADRAAALLAAAVHVARGGGSGGGGVAAGRSLRALLCDWNRRTVLVETPPEAAEPLPAAPEESGLEPVLTG